MKKDTDKFNQSATKNDIKASEERLSNGIKASEERLSKKINDGLFSAKDEIREVKEELSIKIDNVLTAVDNITKKYKDHEIEHTANIGSHDRFEKRITRVEKKVGIIAA